MCVSDAAASPQFLGGAMAHEELSEKVESTVAGIRDFAIRLANTLIAIGFRPKKLASALTDETAARAFLGPNAFLLSCAIASGFLGKTLRSGLERTQIDANVIEQLKDLTFTSFLVESVAVFLIALLGSLLVQLMMWGYTDQEKQSVNNVNYYVIGYFGLGSFLVLLVLFAAIPSNPDMTSWRMQWLRPVAGVVVAAWILFCFVLMQRMSFHLLRAAGTGRKMLVVLGRIAVANVLVLGLCVLNFLSPVLQSAPEALVSGSLIDLELQPDGKSLRLVYAVRNDAYHTVWIDQRERPVVGAEIPDRARISAQGSFQEGCGLGPAKEPFVVIDPGKVAVLTSCSLATPELLGMLKDAGFVERARDGGKRRLSRIGEKAFDLSVKFEVIVEGGKASPQEIRLVKFLQSGK